MKNVQTYQFKKIVTYFSWIVKFEKFYRQKLMFVKIFFISLDKTF